MRIVVDTNIIFSALLNSSSVCGEAMLSLDKRFELFSGSYLHFEIMNHWERIRMLSKVPDDQLFSSYTQLLSKMEIVNEKFIPSEIWLAAEEITKGIDIHDVDFVALSIYLDASLWTGDKSLYNGLKKQNFQKVLNTNELLLLRASNGAN